MDNDKEFEQRMRDVSAAIQLKCQFSEVAEMLNQMRQSRLLPMKHATQIVEMRLELESLMNRATGPVLGKGPGGV